MTDLFDRAKFIAIQSVKSWLPDGRQEGNEWVAVNPNRLNSDGSGGFKVNLETGRWKDFVDDEAGNDLVSCYAYVYRDQCELRSSNYSGNNKEGIIQVEAAKSILELYDVDYFPDTKYEWKAPVLKKGYWSGFRQLNRGYANAPDIKESLKWHIEKHGEPENIYSGFTDEKGQILLQIVRWRNEEGKKDDRPFTLWTNGTEYRWRSKNLECLIPLYGLTRIKSNESDPVLMVEGQKSAEEGLKVLDWPVTSIYRHPDKCDLEPLRGREVYYWFDPDYPGRKKLKIMKGILNKLDCIFHPIQSPSGKEKWDLADAIKEGWSKERIYQYIKDQKEKREEQNEIDIDIDGLDRHFRIVGVTGSHIIFLAKETQRIFKYKSDSLSKGKLLTLMDRKYWGECFAKPEGGIAWDSAINLLLRDSAKFPEFDNTKVRGSGAWIDDNRFVINDGKHIIHEGKKNDMYEFKTDYVYEKKEHIPYTTKDPMSCESSSKLIDALSNLNFMEEIDPYLLCGWILLSPFGGALKWRPKIWITGKSGSGKSTILDKIISPIVTKYFGKESPGTSSEAAIRRQAGTSSLPNLHDEMEGETQKLRSNIDDILMFYRVGSGGNGAGIIKTGQDGTPEKWVSQCMALFASIGAGIDYSADKSRITVITLQKGNPKHKYLKMLEICKNFNRAWAISFHSRTLNLWEEIEKSIDIFVRLMSDRFADQRSGDQIGTLLAGAYMSMNDKSPLLSEAKKWIDKINTDSLLLESDKSDEEQCLDEIMNHIIEVDLPERRMKKSIGDLVYAYYTRLNIIDDYEAKYIAENELKDLKLGISSFGIKPMDDHIRIAIEKHSSIRRALKDTPWVTTYDQMLKRHYAAIDGIYGPDRFGGAKKRYLKFDIKKLFYVEPF